MGKLKRDKRRKTRLKFIEFVNQENARLRSWMKYIKNEEPKYPSQVAKIALLTDHWPRDIHSCFSCGWPAPRDSMTCEHCQAEAEDHRDEVEGYQAIKRGY